jgi:protein-S-isoprenylcysteine O-methyltransferase Ste14
MQLVIAKLAVFVLASLGLVYVSRASLAVPGSHGFYRFFAWEAILVLALLNAEAWFREPFSWHQLISWPLLIISLFLVIQGFVALKHMGSPDPQRNDNPMLGFEKTTALVTVGIYGYIRHPLYSSLLALAWGVFFKAPSSAGGFLVLSATLCLLAAARAEEKEDIRFFGQAYVEYMNRTKMFIPYLI